MSLHRRAAKRDISEGPIVESLRAHGFSVAYNSAKDAPDLILGRHGVSRYVEVKTGREKLTTGQLAWWAAWRGNGVIVLRSVQQVPILAKYWTLLDPHLAGWLDQSAR